MLLERFYPDREEDSAYGLPYEELYKEGYRGILFDIDNTLVPHGAPATKKSIALFRKLHAIGFKTVIISNNKEARVKPFADAVSSRYLFKAGKPGKKGETCSPAKPPNTARDFFTASERSSAIIFESPALK